MTTRQLGRSMAHAGLLATLLCAGMVDGTSGAEGYLPSGTRGEIASSAVSAASLRGKIMCGYQGWFRCPGDAANLGWVHWSRNAKRIAPETLTFEMWPDVRELGPDERFAAPGFTHPDGAPAELFSSDNAATVRRHFQWMRDYGLDGAWLQRFVVGLPGGPVEITFPSNWRVLQHVRDAAQRTGRVWAISYDIAAMPTERIYDKLTHDWKKLVDEQVTADPRYVHEGDRPVVQIWGFYDQNSHNRMTAELGNRLVDFFKAPGPYAAFLVGGGDWNWRRNPDADWQRLIRRFDAYAPWNIGNYTIDAAGDKHASTHYWADDKHECEKVGVFWLPVVYPGFSWDNLKQQQPGQTNIARRGGRFLWEQFHELSKLGVDSVYVAMFDEVDEGTAIFKVTSAPPTPGHFVGYEGLPSDWYLRLVGEAGRRLKQGLPVPAEIPLQP
jgi:hypothetical protein